MLGGILFLAFAAFFAPRYPPSSPKPWFDPRTNVLQVAPDSLQDTEDMAKMKVHEIQAELRSLNVTYQDCFDRESLIKRLQYSREATQNATKDSLASSPVDGGSGIETTGGLNRNETLDFRSLSVRQLRQECSKRGIRWGHFIEKEELIQAILNDMKQEKGYCASGQLKPGVVGLLDGVALDMEIAWDSPTPILLDIFATWCGPCKMMAPQLDEAARELGRQARVVKVDSDLHPAVAQRFRVGALPTLIVLKAGKEVHRIEGVLSKDGLVSLVTPFL